MKETTFSTNVLIVEDDPDFIEIYTNKLKSNEYQITSTRRLDEAKELLSQLEFAVIATDLRLFRADTGGFDILEFVKEQNLDTLVIIFTGLGSKEDAHQATKKGAYDYVTKPLDYDHVKQVIMAAIKIREEKIWYRKTKNLDILTDKFIGSSEIIKSVYKQALSIANTANPILICGASGTGKALITETILLTNNQNQFELINCGSFSETTLERKLFGYVKGAFPGAEKDERGLLEQPFSRALVLDMIDKLSLRLQKKILSTMEKQQAYRLGSKSKYNVSVRILATSQEDLKSRVSLGLFSKELYEYLNRSVIVLPPLKDRKDDQIDDVLLLAGYFLNKFAHKNDPEIIISDETSKILQSYDFPGNVQELKEVIQIAVNQTENNIIEPYHLPEYILSTMYSSSMDKMIQNPLSDVVYCPHGHLLSSQVESIKELLTNNHYAYLSVSKTTPKWFYPTLTKLLIPFGIKSINESTIFDDQNTCSVCYKIMSSKLGVFDFSAVTPQAFYELGLLNAIGIPCLLLRNNNDDNDFLSESSSSINYLVYDDETSLKTVITSWLVNLIMSNK